MKPWNAVGLVLGGAVSVQTGAAVAALLFPRVGVAGVVTLRMTIAALVLLVVCRPRLRGHDRRDWLAVLAFGATLAGMNLLIYQAIARIPLGVAITLEVLGPLALSVLVARRAWPWALLALVGVALLGRGGGDLDPVGIACALGAAALWAAYILLSAQVGLRFRGADGLALALPFAAVLVAPIGLLTAGPAVLLDPAVLGVGAAVALLSSVAPYTLELLALRHLPAATFAVLTSLGPAIATVAGFVVLGQALGPLQVLAVALVVVAGAGAVRAGRGGRAAPGRGAVGPRPADRPASRPARTRPAR